MSLTEPLHQLGIPPSGRYEKRFRRFLRASQHPGMLTDPLVRLRRGQAAFELGDYACALADARWCVLRQHRLTAAHRLEGLSALGAAALRMLDLPRPVGGAQPPTIPDGKLLEEAANALRRVLENAPADRQARAALQIIEQLRPQLAREPPQVIRP